MIRRTVCLGDIVWLRRVHYSYSGATKRKYMGHSMIRVKILSHFCAQDPANDRLKLKILEIDISYRSMESTGDVFLMRGRDFYPAIDDRKFI